LTLLDVINTIRDVFEKLNQQIKEDVRRKHVEIRPLRAERVTAGALKALG
jgi:hypothetical protein